MNVFEKLLALEIEREARLKRIEDALKQLQMPSGTASIEDYKPNTFYKRNTLVVDSATETVYRTLPREGYTSTTLEQDLASLKLKLVGYESQFVAYNRVPSQDEVDLLPEDCLVAVYSSTDDPLSLTLTTDNVND